MYDRVDAIGPHITCGTRKICLGVTTDTLSAFDVAVSSACAGSEVRHVDEFLVGRSALMQEQK